MIKRTLLLLFLLWSVNSYAQEVQVEKENLFVNNIDSIIQPWLDYYKLDFGNFMIFESGVIQGFSVTVESFNPENNIYFPFYKYSPDSLTILDLFSYSSVLEKDEDGNLVYSGGEVDSEVSIQKLDTNIWKRILFVGPWSLIEDGFWISNTKLVILGEEIHYEVGIQPIIWSIDLEKNFVSLFEYKDIITDIQADYLDNTFLKNIKIKE